MVYTTTDRLLKTKKSSYNKPGSDLLSHAIRQSTISAIGFHVRVRNGIVCFTNAITTRLTIRASLRFESLIKLNIIYDMCSTNIQNYHCIQPRNKSAKQNNRVISTS